MTASPRFAAIREGLWLASSQALESLGWPAQDPITVSLAGWQLVLDRYHVPVESFDHTRMVVALPHRQAGFRFRVFEPDALTWITSLFGLLDIEIGDELFDRDWVVKSNSPKRIRTLLADPSLRNQIAALEHCALSLEADPSRDEHEPVARGDELVLICADLPPTAAAIRQMFDVLATTIEGLEALESTEPD